MAVAAKRKRASRKIRNTVAARRVFLDKLALSANVTAAAKAACMATAAVYRQRLIDPQFRADWHAALCEGYARLETELLAEALAPVDAAADDVALRARQYKQRLALALLTAHRSAVRGERGGSAQARRADETKGAKARLIATLDAMAARVAEDDAADVSQ
jgi:hypothetical protein